jgi:hypothetical protein
MATRGNLTAAQVQQMIEEAVEEAVQQNVQDQQQLAQQLAQANQQINALQAGQAAQAAAVIPAGAQPVQAIPPPLAFALSPSTAIGLGINNLIDYNSKSGSEVAKAATAKLSVEHDLDREHLNGFLESLRSRAIQQGWYDRIFRVNQNGVPLNIIESYGSITRESIDAAAQAQIFAENRNTQDTINLFACLEETLTQEARDTLYAESEGYTYRRGDVQVPAIAGTDPNEKRRDGMIFLWTIINRTTARTNATVTVIIHQLNHLEAVMTESNSDITVFNTKVRKLLNSYFANKRVQFDEQVILTNLADAYKTCKDNEFVTYINRKWQDHIDESRPVTSGDLMELALKQYQTMMEQSKWGVDNSKQTKQIMNITAQVENLRKRKIEKEETSPSKYERKTTTSDKPFVSAQEWRKQRYAQALDWMKQEPEDRSKTLTRGKNKYVWCAHHKLWQKHASKDCRLSPAYVPTATAKAEDPSKRRSDKEVGDKANEKVDVKYQPKSLMATDIDQDNFDADF